MDLRAAQGFLGTDAYLLSDLSLLAYIFLIVPGMIAGFIFARRKLFVPHHKYMMTTVVIVNWFLIAFLMVVTYSAAVAPNVPERLNEPKVLIPSIHLLTGGVAQILGTILVLRMWLEYRLPKALRFEPIKPYMRLTLALWLITAVLGIGIYLTHYGVPFSGSSQPNTAPVATQEATEAPPAATEEVGPATPDVPAATEEATQPAG